MIIGSNSFRPLASSVPIEAVLFDIDGTLCDSDPLHHVAFQEMLLEIGYNNGVPIDEEFFINNIAGRSDVEAAQNLFPDWPLEKGLKFLEDKEAKYRSLAKERLEPVKGLAKVVQWVKDHGYKRAAVTNAPRINSELMISLLGLTDFFQAVIVGGECEKPKPAPFPYLKALKELQVSADHTFIFEVNHFFFICICCKLVIWFYLQLKNVCFCCRILLQAHVQALLLEFLLLLWQQGTQRSPYWMQEPR
jgi:beta-phosphoglucomutase-like phosphatase (HAD superfamily)